MEKQTSIQVDKYTFIDSMILELDAVNVSGVRNMRIILETINKLSALKQVLQNEEKGSAMDQNEPQSGT